ncbi:MAG: GYD domain-containing protein [Verrucomicrobiales bacterium]
MKQLLLPAIAAAPLIALLAPFLMAQEKTSSPPIDPAAEEMRLFMFSSKPSPEAWQFMKANPGDRKAAVEGAMEKIGCRMIGYYWGLTNARNFIIAEVPDNETVAAMLVQRLSTDLVLEYEAMELLRSSDMPAVFERLKEIEAADDSTK